LQTTGQRAHSLEADSTTPGRISIVSRAHIVGPLVASGILKSTRDIGSVVYPPGDTAHVRADVCSPCQSRGFSLRGTLLPCGTRATLFDVRDGSGIKGACVDYPKASAPYGIIDNTVAMRVPGLIEAFDATVIPGRSARRQWRPSQVLDNGMLPSTADVSLFMMLST